MLLKIKKNLNIKAVKVLILILICSLFIQCQKENEIENTASFTMNNKEYIFQNNQNSLTNLKIQIDPTNDKTTIDFFIFDKINNKNYIAINLNFSFNQFKKEEILALKTRSFEQNTQFSDLLITFHYIENNIQQTYAVQGGNNFNLKITEKPEKQNEVFSIEFEIPGIHKASETPNENNKHLITNGKINAIVDSYTWNSL